MVIPSCGMHSVFFGYGWLVQIIIFIAFFMVVWWLLKNQKICSENKTIREKPIDILKRRLASGEINKKEFEKLKKEIE